MVTFTSGKLTYQAVIANLHLLDYDRYIKLSDAIKAADHASVLLQFDGILAEGFENVHFISGLASHFRNLLVAKEPSTLELMDVPHAVRQEYQRQAAGFPVPFLVHGITICTRAEAACRTALNARLTVELALLQLCTNASALEAEKKNPERIEQSPAQNPPAAEHKPSPASAPDANLEKPPIQAEPVPAPGAAANKANLFAPPPAKLNVAPSRTEVKANTAGILTDRENPYTPEDFKSAWISFAGQMNLQGKTALATLMQNTELQHLDGFVVRFSVPGSLQLELINEVRSDMMMFLRQQLANDKVQLDIEVIKVETEKKPYTNAEKFKWMAQQNPDLENLRRQLDLDI
jgi:DNA polymerase-3 subunit gamma/tau